ncbi:MAG: hypothetical protein PHU25_15520 [Deltaproteobacteria bacterium]|nr:hypothetical protein [Deltaproteobacteria bacterium]
MTVRRIAGLIVLAMAISSVFCAAPASASEARLEGLAGNPLVEDDMSVVDFPGLLTAYTSQVFLTVRPDAIANEDIRQAGEAGIIAGDGVAFGIWVNRIPRWDDLNEMNTLFDLRRDLPTTYNLLDLFLAGSNGLGVRVSVGAGLEAEDREVGDAGVEPDTTTGGTGESKPKMLSSGGTTFTLDIQPGYTVETDAYHGDFGAGVTLNYFEIVEEGRSAYRTSWVPSFLVRHRSVLFPRKPLAWIADAMVTRRAYTVEAKGTPKEGGDLGRWAASLTVGPKLRFPRDVTVWVGARFTIEDLSGKISKQPQPDVRAIGFPGLVASAEAFLFDRLSVRAGASYQVEWTDVSQDAQKPDATSRDTADLAPKTKRQGMGQTFLWSTGLGVLLGDFRIDGTVTHEIWFNGPAVVGGGNPGLTGLLSANYAW